ncbi:hypothetical protein ABT061_15715 [Streptosporangium sp. NPDC002544]|uniref:hypothetical protein n=1 Tax=Streptosporangium sp. NPDC002544 TaxID=3154538 RepID=UPI00332D24F5
MTADPDISAEWTTLRTGLTRMLQPHVQDAVRDDLVKRIVAELVNGPGWRPPIKALPAVIRDARVHRYLTADQENPS